MASPGLNAFLSYLQRQCSSNAKRSVLFLSTECTDGAWWKRGIYQPETENLLSWKQPQPAYKSSQTGNNEQQSETFLIEYYVLHCAPMGKSSAGSINHLTNSHERLLWNTAGVLSHAAFRKRKPCIKKLLWFDKYKRFHHVVSHKHAPVFLPSLLSKATLCSKRTCLWTCTHTQTHTLSIFLQYY